MIDAELIAGLAGLLGLMRQKMMQGPGAIAAGDLTPGLIYEGGELGAAGGTAWNLVPFTATTTPKKILEAQAERRRVLILNLSTAIISCAPNRSDLPTNGIPIPPAQFAFTGQPHTFIGVGPGAGSDFGPITVPVTSVAWRIRLVAANLSTSVAAGNRIPDLLINISSLPMRIAGSQPTPPSTSNFYYWIPGAPNLTNANQLNQWHPTDLLLPVGATLASATPTLQAGDQWGTPILYVEELVQIGVGGLFEDREPALHRGEWWISAPANAVGLVAELRGPTPGVPSMPSSTEVLPVLQPGRAAAGSDRDRDGRTIA